MPPGNVYKHFPATNFTAGIYGLLKGSGIVGSTVAFCAKLPHIKYLLTKRSGYQTKKSN